MTRISALAAVVVALGAFTAEASHLDNTRPSAGVTWVPVAVVSPFTYPPKISSQPPR